MRRRRGTTDYIRQGVGILYDYFRGISHDNHRHLCLSERTQVGFVYKNMWR